ncbi:phosphonate C-P lyase system protein PhnH [Bacillus gobiensis]|uniref:phosphonate C-P lyase system protein PhnH n=1 Tax=Bacillus gobiensis TaxID=1441095 RepID=UPI003D2304B4
MQKAKDSSFDMVHDTQAIYRKLLDGMARPGKINSIAPIISRVEQIADFPTALLGLAYTLVDREASFAVLSVPKEEIEKHIHWKTLSPIVAADAADYVFINHALEKEEIQQVMGSLRTGTLENPHESATLLLAVESFSEEAVKGQKLILRGPGIQHSCEIHITGFSIDWLEERKRINGEFPIGIDMILVSRAGEVLAIPRTTVIEWEEC